MLSIIGGEVPKAVDNELHRHVVLHEAHSHHLEGAGQIGRLERPFFGASRAARGFTVREEFAAQSEDADEREEEQSLWLKHTTYLQIILIRLKYLGYTMVEALGF